ncbi:hypothetical protein A7X76_07785 [Stenotrophomonas maltophilia]|nr:hypothetical protein A7X76_07785 [Stenotrophomonas maltophilia]
MIANELERTRAKELREAAERQSLARTSLDDLFSNLEEINIALSQDDKNMWDKARLDLELAAIGARDDFARVSPVLKQTPNGSLHCFHIEESLAKFVGASKVFFEPLLTTYGGNKFIKPWLKLDDAKVVAEAIKVEADQLLRHIANL